MTKRDWWSTWTALSSIPMLPDGLDQQSNLICLTQRVSFVLLSFWSKNITVYQMRIVCSKEKPSSSFGVLQKFGVQLLVSKMLICYRRKKLVRHKIWSSSFGDWSFSERALPKRIARDASGSSHLRKDVHKKINDVISVGCNLYWLHKSNYCDNLILYIKLEFRRSYT